MTQDKTTREKQMRTVNTSLVEEYAEQIRPLLPLARRAFGTQAPDSPPREASKKVNALLTEYCDEMHGNITHLARELEGDISLAGLRRRVRVGRAQKLGISLNATTGRGTRDPEEVAAAAQKIRDAQSVSTPAYGEAVREVYNSGISLNAVAKELQVSYFALWTAASSAA